jgi:hypothetical protein
VAVLFSTALSPATGEDNGGLKTTYFLPFFLFTFFFSPASAVMLKLG